MTTNEDVYFLKTTDIEKIHEKIVYRQEKFGESLLMSIGVVLMNYGDGEVDVVCVNNEWVGKKKDLQPRDGIPLCPNGHPLYEVSTPPRLALVKEN